MSVSNVIMIRQPADGDSLQTLCPLLCHVQDFTTARVVQTPCFAGTRFRFVCAYVTDQRLEVDGFLKRSPACLSFPPLDAAVLTGVPSSRFALFP